MESMLFFPVLVVSFAISLGLTPISRQIAMRLGVVDKPNHRKIHHDHKPLMGGLAIYVAFTVSVLLFSPPTETSQLLAVLGGAALVALIGLIDDRYNLGIRIRLIAVSFAAIGIVLADIRFEFFPSLPLLNALLTIFWILAITNAVNFLDNMDGLSSGLSSIAAFFFLMIAIHESQILVSLLAAAILGSAVGFLSYNFAPAATFMGDMGALTLGFVLSVIAIKLQMVVPPISPSWAVPVLVMGLPAFDINLVIMTRIYERRQLGEAGKDHTSHRLMAAGLGQRQTLFILYFACVFFGLMGYAITILESNQHRWLLVSLMVVFVVLLYGFMFTIRRKYQGITPATAKSQSVA